MRLGPTAVDPEKSAEYRSLLQVGGGLCRAHTLEKLLAFADKCGFKRRLRNERMDATRGRRPRGIA